MKPINKTKNVYFLTFNNKLDCNIIERYGSQIYLSLSFSNVFLSCEFLDSQEMLLHNHTHRILEN